MKPRAEVGESMEISEAELLDMVRSTAEQHRDAMATAKDEAAALHAWAARTAGTPETGTPVTGTPETGTPEARTPETGTLDARRTTRRRFLATLGAGGLAVSIGSAVVPLASLVTPAYAASGPTDQQLSQFAESLELAAVAAYTAASASAKIRTASLLPTFASFSAQHSEHAAAYGDLAGDAATATANPTFGVIATQQIEQAADERAVVQVLLDTENTLSSTYLTTLGTLTSTATPKVFASIIPVESQHATVLGISLGLQLSSVIPPFLTVNQQLDYTKFPVAGGTR
jgi:hypothetical protein